MQDTPNMALHESSEDLYDLRGLSCPLTVLKLEKKIKTLKACKSGGNKQNFTIKVLTNDPLARVDIPYFCANNNYNYEIQKIPKDAKISQEILFTISDTVS